MDNQDEMKIIFEEAKKINFFTPEKNVFPLLHLPFCSMQDFRQVHVVLSLCVLLLSLVLYSPWKRKVSIFPIFLCSRSVVKEGTLRMGENWTS